MVSQLIMQNNASSDGCVSQEVLPTSDSLSARLPTTIGARGAHGAGFHDGRLLYRGVLKELPLGRERPDHGPQGG
jgi:hypothetical protein